MKEERRSGGVRYYSEQGFKKSEPGEYETEREKSICLSNEEKK